MKLIILDRDGVINIESRQYIKNPDEWIPIPGSLEAIAKLNECGYSVVVATNQSGISRGLYDVATLAKIHKKMHKALAKYNAVIDTIFYCPHKPDDACHCRKPKSGLFKQISAYYDRPLTGVPIVGDSYRDLQAGMELGCKPILVKTGNGESMLERHSEELARALVCENLLDVAHTLCGNNNN